MKRKSFFCEIIFRISDKYTWTILCSCTCFIKYWRTRTCNTTEYWYYLCTSTCTNRLWNFKKIIFSLNSYSKINLTYPVPHVAEQGLSWLHVVHCPSTIILKKTNDYNSFYINEKIQTWTSDICIAWNCLCSWTITWLSSITFIVTKSRSCLYTNTTWSRTIWIVTPTSPNTIDRATNEWITRFYFII
jgi:hypothetical protein